MRGDIRLPRFDRKNLPCSDGGHVRTDAWSTGGTTAGKCQIPGGCAGGQKLRAGSSLRRAKNLVAGARSGSPTVASRPDDIKWTDIPKKKPQRFLRRFFAVLSREMEDGANSQTCHPPAPETK